MKWPCKALNMLIIIILKIIQRSVFDQHCIRNNMNCISKLLCNLHQKMHLEKIKSQGRFKYIIVCLLSIEAHLHPVVMMTCHLF